MKGKTEGKKKEHGDREIKKREKQGGEIEKKVGEK